MLKESKSLPDLIFFSSRVFGHSKEGAPMAEWQTLQEHSVNVADKARSFTQAFASGDWGWVAGILHDVGKIDPRFQVYLRNENQIDDREYDLTVRSKVNHSSAGAALAEEIFNTERHPLGRFLSYLIAGHHAGLPDYYSTESGRGALEIRLVEGRENLERIRGEIELLVKHLKTITLKRPEFVKKENLHLWLRMVFSSLVDADFLDTELFMNHENAQERVVSKDLLPLKKMLDRYLDELIRDAAPSEVNRIRAEVLAKCRLKALEEASIFSLSVPTGGGKTLSGMCFALEHAIRNGKNRIIYVIPYTSIIEQTSAVFSKIFGPENIIEHHCNIDPETITLRASLATENWDAPIIVTTNVQFFESLFSAKTSRCRKLHNIVNSVIILDEPQLFPPEKFEPIAFVLSELTKNYGCSILLSSATQPVLEGLSPKEITPPEMNLARRLSRVKFEWPSTLEHKTDWPELAQELGTYKQALCIVNTRRDCYELFQLMPKGTFHLSTLMCAHHRSQIIEKIKCLLREGREVRAISTQLVEAGVDIDFPVVYRALCGFDSSVQSAGRCNREGRLTLKGLVRVFIPNTKVPRGMIHKGVTAAHELISINHIDMESHDTMKRYFQLFFSKVNSTGDEFLSKLTPSDAAVLDMKFRTVGREFNLIDDQDQQTVFVRYERGEDLIHSLRKEGPHRKLMRKLQRYSVSIHRRQFETLRTQGYFEEIWPGFIANSSALCYDKGAGLDIFQPTVCVEDLII